MRFPRAKLLQYAREEAQKTMRDYGDGKYARGLANEGFVGGFYDALLAIDMLDNRVVPQDRSGFFEKAARRIIAEQENLK